MSSLNLFLLVFIFVNELYKKTEIINFSETFYSRKKYTFEGRQIFRVKQYAIYMKISFTLTFLAYSQL